MTVNDDFETLQKDAIFFLRHCFHVFLESRRRAQEEYQPEGIEPATSGTRREAIPLEQHDSLRKENIRGLLFYAKTAR